MRGKIEINGKELGMVANAASPILYKRVFKQDWFKTLSEFQEDETGIESIGCFEQMGFIMAMQAVKTVDQLCNLTYSDYLNWLEQFGAEDLMMAVGDIANIYRGQEQTISEPKKGEG